MSFRYLSGGISRNMAPPSLNRCPWITYPPCWVEMTTQTKKTTIRLPPLLHHLHLHQTPHISNPCQVQCVILPLKKKVYCSWFANVCRLVCLFVEHMLLFKNFHENPACLKIFCSVDNLYWQVKVQRSLSIHVQLFQAQVLSDWLMFTPVFICVFKKYNTCMFLP